MVHIAASATPEFRAIREQLRRTRVRLGKAGKQSEQAHDAWKRGVDARLTGFAKLANIVESAELALKFLDEELSRPSWWQGAYGLLPSANDLSIYLREFSQFSKAGLLQLGFGSLESTLRIFLKAIDPNACSGATTEFKSVYECLFRTKIKGLQSRLPLLDLLRMTRNTVHNNGVHYHKTGNDKSLTYKGNVYEFPTGRPVEFATWPLIADLFGDAVELLVDVVNAPEVADITTDIIDPYSQSNDP